MKKMLLVTVASAVLVGCASSPYGSRSELLVEKKVHAMTRQQVINGISDCEAAGMRPVVIMSKRRVGDYYSDIIIDVTCAPRAVQYYR
jgi:hypothetical protein